MRTRKLIDTKKRLSKNIAVQDEGWHDTTSNSKIDSRLDFWKRHGLKEEEALKL